MAISSALNQLVRVLFAVGMTVALLLCALDAHAADDAVSALQDESTPLTLSESTAAKAAQPSSARLFTTLGVVFGLAIGGALGLKRWAKHNRKHAANTRIQILTQHHLGPKKSLAIIQVAGEAILIGVTDHNISMLKTLSLIDDEVPGVVPRNFADALERDDDAFQMLGRQTPGGLA